MHAVVAVMVDVAVFIAVPWLSWRLLGRRIPFAVLPIIVGLLLAVFVVPKTGAIIATDAGQKLGFLGVLLLAFSAGMESRLIALPADEPGVAGAGQMPALSRLLACALLALLLPGMAGTALAKALLLQSPAWVSPRGGEWLGAIAIGLCIAISALPVLVGIVREFDGQRRWLGNIALRIAAVDDAMLWSGLAALLLAAGSGQDFAFTLPTRLALLVLVLLCICGRWLKRAPPAWLVWPQAALWLWLGEWSSATLGLHELLGAYFAGAVLPLAGIRKLPVDAIGKFALFVLAPLFFGHSGLRIVGGELGAMALLAAFGLMLLTASGKLLAVRLYPPLPGLPLREILGIGALLQCKGLMEIVAATVLRDKGLLSEHAFAVLVTLAVLSTLLTGPLFNALLPRERAPKFAPAAG